MDYADMETSVIALSLGLAITFAGLLWSWLGRRDRAQSERDLELGLFYSWTAADLIDRATEPLPISTNYTYRNQYGEVVGYAGVLR